ncbi:MAG TPA: vWA domain-containing protein, partial [Pyrinomonadaceae bacterium]|nr:vWA domain-containing protein [Pyrinomonadaceae bacterium]
DTGGELRYVKSLDRTRKIAANFISSLKQGDSVAILQYSDKPEIILEWTTNLELAKNSLKLANFGRRSSLVKAVDLAVDFLKKSNLDNKHLLLITDGTDSSNNQQTLRNTFRKLLGVDVSVHIISFAQAELLDLAERTKTISDSAPPKALPPEVIAQLPPGVRDTASAPKVGPTINVDRKMLNVLRERQRQLQNAQIDLQRLADDSNGELIDPVDVEQMLDKAAYIAKVVDSTYVVTYIPKLSVAESKRERIVSVSSKRNNVVITGTRKLLPPGQ